MRLCSTTSCCNMANATVILWPTPVGVVGVYCLGSKCGLDSVFTATLHTNKATLFYQHSFVLPIEQVCSTMDHVPSTMDHVPSTGAPCRGAMRNGPLIAILALGHLLFLR